MPSFIVMTLNATEFQFTPGRVTILGEFDGNRLRRTPHRWPQAPERSRSHLQRAFESAIGRGETLVVDTIGILPEVFLPTGQAVALPNNGEMHISERIHLLDPNTLSFELTVTAPHVLAAPWKVSRLFKRQADQKRRK